MAALLDQMNQVQADIINIEAQIDHGGSAKSKGTQWVINATTALRHKKREFQHLQHKVGLMNREARRKAANEFAELFVQSARDMLPAEVFHQLTEKAKSMQSIAQASVTS